MRCGKRMVQGKLINLFLLQIFNGSDKVYVHITPFTDFIYKLKMHYMICIRAYQFHFYLESRTDYHTIWKVIVRSTLYIISNYKNSFQHTLTCYGGTVCVMRFTFIDDFVLQYNVNLESDWEIQSIRYLYA